MAQLKLPYLAVLIVLSIGAVFGDTNLEQDRDEDGLVTRLMQQEDAIDMAGSSIDDSRESLLHQILEGVVPYDSGYKMDSPGAPEEDLDDAESLARRRKRKRKHHGRHGHHKRHGHHGYHKRHHHHGHHKHHGRHSHHGHRSHHTHHTHHQYHHYHHQHHGIQTTTTTTEPSSTLSTTTMPAGWA